MTSGLGPLITTGFGLIVTGIGLKLVSDGYTRRRRANRIEAAETTRVRDMEDGLAEIRGSARPVDGQAPHRAPISAVEAIASHVEVERKSGDKWRTIHENRQIAPFLVADGTGQVRVEPTEEAALNFDDREIEVEPREQASEEIERFARESGLLEEEGSKIIESGTLLNARYRFREGVLEPGEQVYVLGEAFEEEAGWGQRQFVLTGDGYELVVSDYSEGELIEQERKKGRTRMGLGAFVALFGLASLVLPLLGVGTFHV